MKGVVEDLVDIEPIISHNIPYAMDAKIFKWCFCEEECSHELFSYNDQIKLLEDISGVNPELLGPK